MFKIIILTALVVGSLGHYAPPLLQYGPPAHGLRGAPDNTLYGVRLADINGPALGEIPAPAFKNNRSPPFRLDSLFVNEDPTEEFRPQGNVKTYITAEDEATFPFEKYGLSRGYPKFKTPVSDITIPVRTHGSYGVPQKNPQTFNPPQQEYGPPQQEYGPPQQEYGPPQQEYGPPQQEYGPPQEVYGPPQQEYGPPQTEVHTSYGIPEQIHVVSQPQELYGTPAQIRFNHGENPLFKKFSFRVFGTPNARIVIHQ